MRFGGGWWVVGGWSMVRNSLAPPAHASPMSPAPCHALPPMTPAHAIPMLPPTLPRRPRLSAHYPGFGDPSWRAKAGIGAEHRSGYPQFPTAHAMGCGHGMGMGHEKIPGIRACSVALGEGRRDGRARDKGHGEEAASGRSDCSKLRPHLAASSVSYPVAPPPLSLTHTP